MLNKNISPLRVKTTRYFDVTSRSCVEKQNLCTTAILYKVPGIVSRAHVSVSLGSIAGFMIVVASFPLHLTYIKYVSYVGLCGCVSPSIYRAAASLHTLCRHTNKSDFVFICVGIWAKCSRSI